MSNLCEKCRHYNGATLCLHSSNGNSLVTGRPRPMFAVVKRNHENDCGRMAVYFEPIEKKRTLFNMIFGELK